jgi:hypothetical protein
MIRIVGNESSLINLTRDQVKPLDESRMAAARERQLISGRRLSMKRA